MFAFGMTSSLYADDTSTAYHDPALLYPNGHYTEQNLLLNILPEQRANKKFPYRMSKDVVLIDITAGPGSVISNVFSISKEFAKNHTPLGVLESICKNKNLRKTMVDLLDSYRFIYYEGKRYLFSVDVNKKNCASNGW